MSPRQDGDGAGGDDEIDALKWFVYGITAAAVLGAGVAWFARGLTEDQRRAAAAARSALAEIAESKQQALAMLRAFKQNREDEARDQPLTWFQQRWKSKGIPDNSVQPEQWKVPPDIGSEGGNQYVEEKIGIKFQSRNPLRREQIAQFVHEVEASSTRLRAIRLQLQRVGKDEDLAKDEWSGQVEFGYRYPHVK